MKKLILISLITSFAIADYQRTYIEKREEKQERTKNDFISFTGTVYNIREYRDYTEITISTKKDGRIRGKISSNRFLEGQRVSGSCNNYEYGIYTNCSIY